MSDSIDQARHSVIPELEHNCNSWVAVCKKKKTGKVVLETFQRGVAEQGNQEKYEVLTTLQWLTRLSTQFK